MKLELMSHGVKGAVFAETGKVVPKLYRVSNERWTERGKPRVIHI